MRYRAEIDGLRALAVLPVIFFHAGFELFSGGFVGVDIFFVISGYLITSILIDELDRECFSFSGFYDRRARRILPALFFVMLVCIPFGWLWMLPEQMKDFSQSLIAVNLFSSNMFFWQEAGYFDAVSEEKPLLHTWSLAVEEQFYMLFPIFLFLVWRTRKNDIKLVVCVLAVASFLLSEWGLRNEAWGRGSFYLAPTRAWELFAGSLAAFTIQRQGIQASNAKSLFGLALVFFVIVFYDSQLTFPGLYAFPPVLGAVLIIVYGGKETLVAKFLSIRVLVGIGLMSYSAYLWHQPIFAFTKIRSSGEISLGLSSGLIISSLILGFFTWKFIELPFRRKGGISRRQIFTLTVIFSIFFIGFGLAGNKTNGFEWRKSMANFLDLKFDNSRFGYSPCDNELDRTNPKLDFCLKSSETPRYILFGDSHADDKFHGIVENSTSKSWILIGNSSCPPLMGINFVSVDGTLCTDRLTKIFKFFDSLANIEAVVLSFAHMYPLDDLIAADHVKRNFTVSERVIDDVMTNEDTPIKIFEAGLLRTVEYWRGKKVPVILIADVPELEFMPKECLSGMSSCVFERAKVLERQRFHRDMLATLEKMTGVYVFDSLGVLCHGGEEECSILKEGRTLFRDSHHLSHYGSDHFGRAFAIFMDQLTM